MYPLSWAGAGTTLDSDRVLNIRRDDGHPFFDTQYCRPEEDFHNCYFEALSSCIIEDARLAAGAMLHKG